MNATSPFPADSHLAYERAMDELRRQMGFRLYDNGALLGAFFPAEFVDDTQWKLLQPLAPLLLFPCSRTKSSNAVAIKIESFDFETLQALIDPLQTINKHSIETINAPDFSNDVLALCKHAGILPALIFIPNNIIPYAEYSLDISQLHPTRPIEVIRGKTAKLPLEEAEHTRITSFRQKHATSVHLLLEIGDWDKQASPLVRVHSSCVTGDILGSLRCDCGDQLHASLTLIKAQGAGLLLYLHQEGRGIGISNKIRAYQLQEQGHDTYAANHLLGFDNDERDFSIAAAMLTSLGITSIKLLTNNPAKIAFFEKSGIHISERIGLVSEAGRHNHAYLDAKNKKAGHLF